MRKTKIVCTIGPSTETSEMITSLVNEGMNVTRLNTSHDDLETHRARIRKIKDIRKSMSTPLGILMDLSGPKIRTGEFKEKYVNLEKGQEFTLTSEKIIGNKSRVSINYPALPAEVTAGDKILLDDGKIKLMVVSTSDKEIVTEVINGGEITHRRGINVPGIDLSVPALTEKDKNYIKLGIEENVDFFALSFVRKPEDVVKAKSVIKELNSDIPVIAKIETKQALEKIPEIADVADGLMVARGDLGVEIPVEEVPIAQKKIIMEGNRNRIPVITATQMLESMIENPVPTRAETTDISNAITDGTDAIMLSGETSIGKYPIEAVRVMHKTAISTEQYLLQNPYTLNWTREGVHTDSKTAAICRASWTINESLGAKLIVTSTFSGHTARNVSGFRPRSPILAVTPEKKSYYRLAIVWGIVPLLVDIAHGTDELLRQSRLAARNLELVKPGETFIFTAGVPLGVSNTTNILKLEIA